MSTMLAATYAVAADLAAGDAGDRSRVFGT
jgi:hypothetical protein